MSGPPPRPARSSAWSLNFRAFEAKGNTMKRISRLLLLIGALTAAVTGSAGANEVSDWNQIMFQAALATNPLVITRVSAVVQASVFDAVNGIARRYTPIHVAPAAPRASRRAAAVQAAYVTLLLLSGAAGHARRKRAASLAAIHSGEKAKEKGIAWGQTVADAMLAWRSTDGMIPPPPPFLGGTRPRGSGARRCPRSLRAPRRSGRRWFPGRSNRRASSGLPARPRSAARGTRRISARRSSWAA